MQIHVVQAGQSLPGIAQAYGVTPQAIAQANQIEDLPYLVPGQALVIPVVGRYHFVQPGETLAAIGRRYGFSAPQLARVNRLPADAPLEAGMRLYIPAVTTRPPVESNAYVEPMGEEVAPRLITTSREAVPYLTYLAPFSYQLQRDGSLKAPPLNDLPAIARQAQATPMLVITNLEEGSFSAELGRILLNDPQAQERLLTEIVRLIREVGFRDVHFDLEYLRPADREAYNNFLRKAAERIRKAGALLSTALAPKQSAAQAGQWYEAHDYRAHGQIVDFVVLMTYEWGYSGGPPMAVSPINKVRDVLEYATKEIPAQKIMMGQNLYGYDWTLPYVQGGPFAKAISPQEAVRLAVSRGVPIEYDPVAQAPHFQYRDDEGKTHEVWFEDARSIQAKFNLIKEMGLRGISYWKLGLPFPQNWLLLQENFNVTKRPAQ